MQSPSDVPSLLVVDDDPMVTGMFAAGLEPDYRVTQAQHPHAALAWLHENQPDVILLDIEMPDMDGYTLCHRIRTTPALAEVPVIFVSAHDSLEERIQAFDAGGDDFVIKPFDLEEMQRKIARAVRLKAGHWQLAQEKSAAEERAEMVQSLLEEMSLLLNFTRACLGASAFEDLADHTIATLAGMSLNAHVQIRARQATLTRTPAGEASALEESIFERSRDLGRIFSIGRHMVCNYDSFSILINNMPIQDKELCGRIRDHVAVIAETGAAAVQGIELRLQMAAAAQDIQQASHEAHKALLGLRSKYRLQQSDTRCALEGMVAQVERMYLSMGLTENQEHAISETVRAAVEQVLALFQEGIDFEGEFEAILECLDRAASIELPGEAAPATRTELW
jgi:DNA-binding response OmpR family regulator